MPTLQGEAALAHLRREGLDGSLEEALTAARYGARSSPERPDDFTFNNPAQRLRARFDGRGLELESGADPDRLRLTMRLRSLGYGERQLPVGPGEISAAGQRVESVHSLDGGSAAVVREWFVNRPQGLEHGFTLAAPPGERWAGQPLRLVLGLGGTLRAREVEGRQALELVDATGRNVLRYDHLRVSDAGGRKLPARMRVAGGELSFEIDDAGAHFPVTIDPTFTQQAYLKASNTGAGDQFGYSVAISGDTLVVGAVFEDSNATGVDGDPSNDSAFDSGAAYVFVRSAGAWSQQAYLKASNTDAHDWFGYSVAISGDTLVVGAVSEDSNATGADGDQSNNSAREAGAAYVFVRSAGAWSQQAYLKASNTDAGDQFGFSVAISGDTLVVGAFGEDSNATGVDGDQSNDLANGSGAAYVFVRSAGAWSQQAYVKAFNADEFDDFGWSVAISGDALVVGAFQEDSNATGVGGDQSNKSYSPYGAAYVFVRNAGSWSQQAFLKASNTGLFDQFGWSVAISGDTLVVGAIGESSNATGVDGDQANDLASGSGAAYVFGPAADLEMDKAADVSDPAPGDTVVFTLTVTNQGPSGASGVTVTDTLPAGLTYVSNDCGAAFASPTLTWSIGALANLTSATCRLTVTVDGTIVNTAAVTANETDPDPDDNDADATLTFTVADLKIQKTADNGTPAPGGTVVFTLTVTNQGPAGATGVVVIDTLPAGLTYVSNDCGAAFASPMLTWSIGALANLASAACHLTVTVDADASGTIVNGATVAGNELDPQIDNDDDAMLAVDLTGSYTLPPCRLVDTRLADGPLGGPALAANMVRDFVLAGSCGVPADAVAVVLTVTAVGSTAAGGLQVYAAGGTPLANGGIVHYLAGVTRAGNGIVALGAGGAVSALAEQPAGTVHLVLDVVGYFH